MSLHRCTSSVLFFLLRCNSRYFSLNLSIMQHCSDIPVLLPLDLPWLIQLIALIRIVGASGGIVCIGVTGSSDNALILPLL